MQSAVGTLFHLRPRLTGAALTGAALTGAAALGARFFSATAFCARTNASSLDVL